MGNRVTENKKRHDAAYTASWRCYLAGDGCVDDRDATLNALTPCPEHRCSAITRKGTRCLSLATYPDEGVCGMHLAA